MTVAERPEGQLIVESANKSRPDRIGWPTVADNHGLELKCFECVVVCRDNRVTRNNHRNGRYVRAGLIPETSR